MATTKILDAYALIAFLEDSAGADQIRNLFLRAEEGNIKLAITSVNLGEAWYAIAQTSSADSANSLIQRIEGMSIEIVDVDWSLAHQAALYKTKNKISYANCFTVALARSRKGEIVTGDQQFKRLGEDVKVTWI
jgi:ribonuclease VapC